MNFEMNKGELKREIYFDRDERWWNCESNRLAIESSKAALPTFVIVKDETLREGLTVPGRNRLSLEELVEIGEGLEDAGFREIEVGYTAAVDEHRHFAISLKKRSKLRQSAHTRTWASDWKTEIDGVLDAGADIVNLAGFGTSETEKFTQPNHRKDALPDLFAEQIAYSKSKGAFTSFHISANVTRPDIMERCYRLAAEAGADRTNVGDGYGVSTPEGTRYLISRVKEIVGPKVEVGLHAHNDFGLGTANGLAAVTAGATMVDASINSLGDRAGITNSVTLVAALEALYGVETGIKLDRLKALSETVARKWGIDITPHEPVIGKNMYRHETDLHIAALLSGNWFAYNVIRPDVLGEKTLLQFGPASLAKGQMSSVGVKIRKMGKSATEAQVDVVLAKMRGKLERASSGFISEDELEDIISEVI